MINILLKSYLAYSSSLKSSKELKLKIWDDNLETAGSGQMVIDGYGISSIEYSRLEIL